MFSSDSDSPFSPQFSPTSWEEKEGSITAESPKPENASKFKARKGVKASRKRIVRACMRCRLRKTKVRYNYLVTKTVLTSTSAMVESHACDARRLMMFVNT